MIHFFQKLFCISTVLLLLFLVLFIPPKVFAHVLQTDGNIGAIMHIDPNDDPIAGKQSGFFFEFKDLRNKFAPASCTCTFSITENGKEIFSQPLFQNNPSPSLDNASVFFTFPERAIYQVKIVGVPTQENVFQPFTLLYNVRVEQIAQTQQSPNQQHVFLTNQNFAVVTAVACGGVILITILLIVKKRKAI